MFGSMEKKLQCLEEQDQNSNDRKDKRGNLMFGKIGQELQCLER